MAWFKSTYVRLGELAKRLPISGRVLRPRLSEEGIEPAFADEDVALFLDRWEDVRRSKDFS